MPKNNKTGETEKLKQSKSGTNSSDNLLDAFRKKITNMVYGTSNQIQKDTSNTITEFDTEINKILDNLNSETGGQLATVLMKVKNSASESDKQQIQQLEDVLKDETSYAAIADLYMNEKNNLQIYDEYDSIVKYMPELMEALETTVESVTTSDDFTASFNNFIYYNGKQSKNETIQSVVNNIESEYEIEEKFENAIRLALKYGKSYILTRPLSNIFTEVLKNREALKTQNMTSESLNIINESISKYSNILSESKTVFNNTSKKSLSTNDISEVLSEFYNNIEICENNITPKICNDLISEADFKSGMSISSMVDTNKNKNSYSDGLGVSNATISKTDKSSNVNINGCIFEVLSPKFIIPIKAGKSVLGYYYIEAEEEFDKLKSYSSNGLRTTYVKNIVNTQPDNANKFNDFFTSLTDIVVKKIDKKFIESNQDIKHQIYDFLTFNENYKKKIKISFIDPEYIEELTARDGNGMFYYTLFLAKIYIALVATASMIKITKGYDKELYYVKTGIDKSSVSAVNSVTRSLQKKKFSFDDIFSSVNKLFRLTGTNYCTMVVPTNSDGDKPFETDVISAQDTNVRDDFIDFIQQAALNSTGVPSVILNYVNEADYAKTLIMANAKYARFVLKLQRKFNLKLTNVYRKILKYEYPKGKTVTEGDSEIINYEDFSIILPTPKVLINNIMADTTNMYESNADIITKLAYPTSKEELFHAKFMRKNLSNLDFNEIDRLVEETDIEWIDKYYNATSDKTNDESGEQ